MKTAALYLICLCCLLPLSLLGQRGKIIRPATTNVMDPDGDGFITQTRQSCLDYCAQITDPVKRANCIAQCPSCTTQCPFSSDGNYDDEFEIRMFPIPQIGNGDVTGDNVGNSCGITDLIPDVNGRSVYAVHQTTNGQNNLIFRFRVGDDNPSVEAWSILLDTDGLFGTNDPNATADNPGFEIDITLIKRNNAGVYVYNIDGVQNCPTPILSYPINSHFQISIADLVTCADPDYFYDYFVPFGDLASAFNISTATGMRFAAVVNTSATCAMSGNIADVSGVDNNDPLYDGCVTCAFEDLVQNQCATPLADLCPGCAGFQKDKVYAPAIKQPLWAGQTSVTGTTNPLDADKNIFILVEVYTFNGTASNGVIITPSWETTPRTSIGAIANGANWSVDLTQSVPNPGPLQSFDRIKAIAKITATSLGCGASGGNETSSTSVTTVDPEVPVANNQSVTTNEDTSLEITFSSTVISTYTTTYSILTNPAHGTLSSFNALTGKVTYTPTGNYNGPDVFTFAANYDNSYSAVGTINITVNPLNDAPIANNQSVTTTEDVAKIITLTGSDVDGNALTYSIVNPPLNGVLSIIGADVTYTPNLNHFGSDSFTFKANDGTTDSNTATVSITITGVNDAPVASPQSVTTVEDASKAITLVGSDPDGNPLTYSIVTGPGSGTLSGTGANLTYTPASNFNGGDSFTFKVNDGTTDSNIATITIAVTAVNDAPVASAQSVTTLEDIAKAITLIGTDVDGDVLSYSIVGGSGPTNGTLSGSGANVTYTPAPNFFGTDVFTFKVSDGTIESNSATVSINVTGVNDAPVASPQSLTTLEDASKAITLVGTDPDGNPLTYSIVTGPSSGTLSGTGANLTYTPASNFNGGDSFTFKVNDGTTNSNIATITISVTAVNDAPVASAQSVTTLEDIAKAITLIGTDVDGDVLSYSIVGGSGPTNGTLSGSGANVTYTPASNFFGADVFTFKVSDGTTDSNTATVSINVTGVNDAPVASPQSVTTVEDASKAITLVGTDPDGNPLTYSVVTGPASGTLSGAGANLTYIPTSNYNGGDSFTFKVNDGTTDSNIATITITVTAVNDAPIANAQSVSFSLNTAKAITLTGSDLEGDALTFITLTLPSNGTLSGTEPNLTYTPNTGYTGGDSFTFKVNDGTDSNIATVSLFFDTGVPVAPIANPQNVTVVEDVSTSIVLTATDANGDVLTYSIVAPPQHGALVPVSGANFIYTPAPNYFGLDDFTFKASDNALDSSPATVSITVTPVSDLPIADDQSVSVTEDIAKTIALTGNDPDGSSITYALISAPSHGALTGTAPNITYTPAADYNGSDNFTFKINDGTSDSNTATVSITVAPVSDSPVAVSSNSATVTLEDIAVAITLIGSDPDGDPITYIIVNQPSHGTVSGSGANVMYTPAVNYNGSDSFTFKVNDGTTDSNIATVTITVGPIGDVPVASNQSVTMLEDIPTAVTLPANDPDGDVITFSILSQPAHGTLSGSLGNRTYTPTTDFAGSDSFTFKVNDGTTDSNVATVFITVTPVGDSPVAFSSNGAIATIEDQSKNITLVGTDPDGDPITYVIVGNPSHGTLSGSGANVIYTPAPNYNGPDQFTFKVNDGTTDSNVGTVLITVDPVGDVPIADDQSITLQENQVKAITLTGSDPDQDIITHTIVSQPIKGFLTGTAPNVTYTPSADFVGSDNFTFKVRDGFTDSNTATVSITVTAVVGVPTASDQSVTTLEGVAATITLVGNDPDGDALSYAIVSNPLNGLLTGTGANVTYTPNANYNGTDSFTFKVNDGNNDSNIATVLITVTPVTNMPVAVNQSLTTDEELAIAVTLTGSDLDGDPLMFTVLTQPASGVLTGTAPNLTYTPILNFNGNDQFTYKVNDGDSDSNMATISIKVAPINDPPVISPLPVLYTKEDSVLQICLNVVDVDGDVVLFDQPGNTSGGGTMIRDVAPFDFCYKFTPALNYNGESIWELKVNDGRGLTGTATVKIIVLPVNDPPVAVLDSIKVLRNVPTAGNVLQNDFDIEGDNMSVTVIPITTVKHGKIILNSDGKFNYTSDKTFRGLDSLVYEVCDNGSPSACSTGTLVIRVEDVSFKVFEGITPNGDGLNDYLRIDGIDYYQDCVVRIFDRYNNLVFEMEGYDNEGRVWRGQATKGVGNDVLPEGTYFYMVNLGDGSEAINGFVVLKRN